MEHTPDIDLTKVSGIGESLAEHFREEGFENANDVASATVGEVTAVHSIGDTRAREIIDNAQSLLDDESFVNRQYDPYTGEYYDAGVDVYKCDLCDSKFSQRSVYLPHRRQCKRAEALKR